MASRFVENLDTVSTISHPHLNVSLEDILAEEGRKRSSSQSSESSQTAGRRSGSESVASPTSPTNENKMDTIRRRAFTLGSKKGRRASIGRARYPMIAFEPWKELPLPVTSVVLEVMGRLSTESVRRKAGLLLKEVMDWGRWTWFQ
ncbi:hypothetical protein IAQ61_006161 [Plenodomus lingam]|uniref:uncharacterized protein n=1 Tax=Leptosphaeria maculans TaxID=5022 RepID=UPI003317C148|nr:hypothetical protein IAQ61_006161 [Plenodomus lingam]